MPYRTDPAIALTLDEVATELGVHYMTVYRYVRQGRLQAFRSHGVWRVAQKDLAEFRAARERAEQERSRAGGTRRDRRSPADARRRGTYVVELERRLIAGDGHGASAVLQRAIDAGADVDEVYLEILSPVLVSIGERWSRGEIDIAVEHQATSIATRLVGQLSPRFSRPGRRRGVIVIGGPTGERHGLVLAMLGDLLRLEGWDVRDLGPDTPARSFVHAVASIDDLVAIGVSVSSDESVDSARATLAALRSSVDAGVRLVIGGHAIRDLDHARSLGADHWARGAREFAEFLNSLPAD